MVARNLEQVAAALEGTKAWQNGEWSENKMEEKQGEKKTTEEEAEQEKQAAYIDCHLR